MLLLLAQVESEDANVPPGVLYLLRHQTEDGSWGKIPAGCRCGLGPPSPGLVVDEATKRLVSGLIEKFRDDDVAVRQRAQSGLLDVGEMSTPQLWATSQERDPEVAGRCREVLRELENRKESDEGTTGLALLSFLSMGHTHQSRDSYDGRSVGTAVRRGLVWLQSRQDARGAFSPEPSGNAVAALAMTEAFRITESSLWKESAARGCASLGGVKPEDPTFLLIWKGMAFNSWKASESEVAPAACAEIEGILGGRQGTPELAGAVLMGAFARGRDASEGLGRLYALDPARLDGLEFLVVSMAVMRGRPRDPKVGSDWKRRAREVLKQRLKESPRDCREGIPVRDGIRSRSIQVLALWCLWDCVSAPTYAPP